MLVIENNKVFLNDTEYKLDEVSFLGLVSYIKMLIVSMMAKKNMEELDKEM